jgi:periplasmic divalent cation tolerance protein
MDDKECIEICWTSGSMDEARKISRLLVKEGWVACAQIIPWIESIFMWNNKLDTVQESKIVLKTCRRNFEAIQEIIKKNSSYEVPEIIWNRIDGVDKEYQEWLLECVGKVERT